jgi:hypothetical protein
MKYNVTRREFYIVKKKLNNFEELLNLLLLDGVCKFLTQTWVKNKLSSSLKREWNQ